MKLRHGWAPKGISLRHPVIGLEEAELLRAVADQHVLGLLVVIEHHAVGFAANAGLFVSAKRRMRRIGVIAIDPHAPGLDPAAKAMTTVHLARPEAGAESVECVIGDFERIGFRLEGGDGNDRSEDLFLEDAHLVVALEDRRLHKVTAVEFAAELSTLAASQHFRAFLLADINVAEDLLHLLA